MHRSEENAWRLRLWTERPTVPGVWDVQVPAEAAHNVASGLHRLSLTHSLLHEDLGRDIEALMDRNAEIQVYTSPLSPLPLSLFPPNLSLSLLCLSALLFRHPHTLTQRRTLQEPASSTATPVLLR